MDDLRAQFPVLERLAYLNAGTTGPVPRPAFEAAVESLNAQLAEGRSGADYFRAHAERIDLLRARIASLVGAGTDELALTGSTTDGVNAALGALDLGRGDEVLTSDEEHPGLLAPLATLRERRGVRIRVAPFGELAAAIGPHTRLVACSHVSWHTGSVVDAPALAASPARVLLDGAQGLGAVPVDVTALGCDFYAASGQKWLCGPNGIGYLYARAELARELLPPWAGYPTLADPGRGLELELQPDARRLSVGYPAPHDVVWALRALDVLEAPGIEAVYDRAAGLAERLASGLGERVRPRGPSTLVAWEAPDPEAEVERLRGEGFVLRELPGTGTLRASVGAWSTEAEVDRLADLSCS